MVVTPHGASLMNLMLMPPLSAVVELFPYHLHHALYVHTSLHVQFGWPDLSGSSQPLM